MLIHDRRRTTDASLSRSRLTIAQKAKLAELERESWRLAFVRGEHAAEAVVVRGGEQLAVASDGAWSFTRVPVRSERPSVKAVPVVCAAPASGADSGEWSLAPVDPGAGSTARAQLRADWLD